MKPFLVLALPRSRTAWLARFLTYRDVVCGHEELRHARSLADIRTWFSQPCIGSVETAAAPWWRTFREIHEDLNIVTIRRPVKTVVESLVRLGFDDGAMTRAMTHLDHKLDQIERRIPGVLSIPFHDLETEVACAAVFQWCTPYRHDHEWWATLAPINIQVNMPALVRYANAYRPQLETLAKTVKSQTIASMSRHPIIDPEGITIQQEPFDVFLTDGRRLFEEHLIEVGEAPDNWIHKNLELMRRLDELGAMQVTTARSNGRMFGYLMAIMYPSLESPDLTSAMHTTFYASREFPGLGLKLQRASVNALKKAGVGELYLRQGVRGAGARLGTLYRRMGAEDFGQLFKLELMDS